MAPRTATNLLSSPPDPRDQGVPVDLHTVVSRPAPADVRADDRRTAGPAVRNAQAGLFGEPVRAGPVPGAARRG
ncbi:hypothetical protein MRX96_049821 [Rhipicephalus microplus]